MGLDVMDNLRVCRTPPGPKKDLSWHLKPRTIPKKDLNWHLKPIIFVAMSLIIILISGLGYWRPVWVGIDDYWPDPAPLPIIIFVGIIILGVVWKMLSGIIEFYNLKPRTIYVAMILILILLSGRAYYYMPIIIFEPAALLMIICVEIIILGAVWKMLSDIREFNKIKTSSTN